jgi:hypothetical protein
MATTAWLLVVYLLLAYAALRLGGATPPGPRSVDIGSAA